MGMLVKQPPKSPPDEAGPQQGGKAFSPDEATAANDALVRRYRKMWASLIPACQIAQRVQLR
jgi:hypothetical protein